MPPKGYVKSYVCSVCNTNPRRVFATGRLDTYCKQCRKDYNNHPDRKERYLKMRRDYETSNPLKTLLSSLKTRAKHRGLTFNLTEADIIIPDVCPALGLKLNKLSVTGNKDNSPSVDRIDNTKGYISGNIIVVSHLANSMKRNGTIQQLRLLADFYENLAKVGENNGT